jgi:hypothetical protein
LRGIERGLQKVDKSTVKALELRAPGVSALDAQFLRYRILGGAIFSGFSVEERAVICGNILAFKGIIPSLFKFFQDIHFLQACVDGVKWLVTVPPNRTVFTALGQWYTGERTSQRLQVTETTFKSEIGSPTHCMRLGYLQLFAFAMRHHQSLSKASVKKNLKTMPRVKADREVLQRFAALAEQLGFNTPEIEALKGDFDHLPITNTQESIPLLITTGPGESIKHRCGLPHIETFEKDRKYLFLHNLCHESDEVGEGITSFFVLKSWFTAFFDPPRWTRPILSVESSNPLSATHGYVDKEDVNIGGEGRGIPNQRERREEQQQIREVRSPQMDTDEHMQETTELEQQRLSGRAIDANQILEGQEAFFGSFPMYDA